MSAILLNALKLGAITERQYRTVIYKLAADGITRSNDDAGPSIPVDESRVRHSVEHIIDLDLIEVLFLGPIAYIGSVEGHEKRLIKLLQDSALQVGLVV
jgi:hypothetical protein